MQYDSAKSQIGRKNLVFDRKIAQVNAKILNLEGGVGENEEKFVEMNWRLENLEQQVMNNVTHLENSLRLGQN